MDFQQALQPAAEAQISPEANQELLINNEAPAAVAADPATSAVDSALNNLQSQTPNNNEADTAPAATAQPPVDYNTLLDQMSEGIIKDQDSFKAAIPKLKEYDTLKKTNEELSAQMAAAPKFANDYVRTLNTLVQNGASVDQLKGFQKINEYGDINEMADREARITKMVMIDGVKPSVAALKVDREFKLNEELDEEERTILDDDLRVAAINDRTALSQYKANLSEVQPPAEEIQLQQQARLANHIAQVKPYVAEVVAGLPNLGTFNLSGKDGADAVNFELPIDETARTKMAQYMSEYLSDGLTPVTPETTREAANYARYEYMRENTDKVLRDAFNKGVELTTEKLTNKYENRSGLKKQEDNPVIGGGNPQAAMANFMASVVNKG